VEWANGPKWTRGRQGFRRKSEVRGQNAEVKPEVRTRFRFNFCILTSAFPTRHLSLIL
jgi:hypothetical protein